MLCAKIQIKIRSRKRNVKKYYNDRNSMAPDYAYLVP